MSSLITSARVHRRGFFPTDRSIAAGNVVVPSTAAAGGDASSARDEAVCEKSALGFIMTRTRLLCQIQL